MLERSLFANLSDGVQQASMTNSEKALSRTMGVLDIKAGEKKIDAVNQVIESYRATEDASDLNAQAKLTTP